MRALLAAALLVALPASAGAFSYVTTQGCAAGKGAAWPARLLPSAWMLDQTGYPGGPSFADVQAALEKGITAWEAPCCSAFRGTYAGTTSETALGLTKAPNVVSFRTSNWAELGLGASTIAVTWPQWTTRCELVGADMLFNAEGFTFRVDGGDTDLQSIAAHEFGHWLGLGHTASQGATMVATYAGGVAQRTIEQDDADGVCDLYPGDCRECARDADCPAGQACNAAGACRAVTCAANADCPAASACVDGLCHAGCRSDAECPLGSQCHNAACITACAVCDACTQESDCGAQGYLCMDMGGGLRCTEPCGTDADCEGDSVCRSISPGGTTMRVCSSPRVTRTSYCPGTYACQLITGCPGLWSECAAGCARGSDACVNRDGVNRCTCSCRADEDCGADAACDAGQCVPRKVLDPCWGVTCSSDQVCKAGRCMPKDPCSVVTCQPGEVCQVDALGNPSCVSPCGACPPGTRCSPATATCEPFNLCDELQCPEDQVCNRDTQACEDVCARVVCEAGLACQDGVCVPSDPCATVRCEAGSSCVDGACVPTDPCAAVLCAANETCVEGACTPAARPRPVIAEGCSGSGGSFSFLALGLALLLLRRRA